MNKDNKQLVAMNILVIVYLLSFFIASHDTYAWMTSKTEAHGSIDNATTEDLLAINPEVLSYEGKCQIKVAITITNLSKLNIPIQLEHLQKVLAPNDTLQAEFSEKVSCESSRHTYHLLGLNQYIDEYIEVPLDRGLLIVGKGE